MPRPVVRPLDPLTGAPALPRGFLSLSRRRVSVDRPVVEQIDVNPTGVIGPDDHLPSRMGHVCTAMFRAAIPATIGGAFDRVDVCDVVDSMLEAELQGRTGESDLLPGHRASMADLATVVEKVAGVPPPRLRVPMWLADAVTPLAEREARWRGRPPQLTREALHALKSDPHVNGDKARNRMALHRLVRAAGRQGRGGCLLANTVLFGPPMLAAAIGG
jgi:dihydroflavonol-4-reductase